MSETTANMRPMLELSGIAKSWGARAVLRGVDLAVDAGTTLWLGGENAAGKTTLLRIVAGLVTPDAGTVTVGGAAPDGDRRAHNAQLGWLPPGDRGLYARLSVRANLELAAGLALVPRARQRDVVADAIARWGLDAEADRRVDRLSMGQRQRVRVAGALIHEPALLLLDEPHTSLDGPGLERLAAELDRRIAAGATVVWCSPPIDRDRLPAARGYLLRAGELHAA